eukprot:5438086-Lingulodinium_polyedra.AAC.1
MFLKANDSSGRARQQQSRGRARKQQSRRVCRRRARRQQSPDNKPVQAAQSQAFARTPTHTQTCS